MADVNKGRSPFYPGQPVPPEFFVGRDDLVQTLMRRGAGQVAAGKPVAFFIQGEYGIGKSSLATYAQAGAANKFDLHSIYVSVGGAKTVEDVARMVSETVRSSCCFGEVLDHESDHGGVDPGDGGASPFFAVGPEPSALDEPGVRCAPPPSASPGAENRCLSGSRRSPPRCRAPARAPRWGSSARGRTRRPPAPL